MPCECGREFNDPRGCKFTHVVIKGKTVKRNTSQFDDGAEQQAKCPDCGTPRGKQHHLGCDTERCPVCRMQAIGCDCSPDGKVEYTTGALKGSPAESTPANIPPIALQGYVTLPDALVDSVMTVESLAELKKVSQMVKIRWAELKAREAQAFKAGDKVIIRHFDKRGGQNEYAIVLKVNRTTVSVRADNGGLWKCSPNVLQKVGV